MRSRRCATSSVTAARSSSRRRAQGMTRVARRDLTLGSGTLAWEPVGEAGREGSPLELVILERAIPARARCRVCFAIFRAGSPSTPWFCSVSCVPSQLPAGLLVTVEFPAFVLASCGKGSRDTGWGRCRLAPGPDKGGLGSSLPCCVGHCCCSFSPSLWSRHIRLLRPNFRWREQACRCTLLLARGDARLLRLAAATPSGRDTDAGAGGYRNLVCWRDGLPDCHQRDARAGAA